MKIYVGFYQQGYIILKKLLLRIKALLSNIAEPMDLFVGVALSWPILVVTE